MALLRSILLALSRHPGARAVATRSRLLRPVVRRFVPGETMEAAFAAAAELRERGIAATLDLLGEATTSVQDAHRAAEAYLELLGALARRGLDAHLSLKLSQLGLDLSADLAGELLERIARTAEEVGTFVRVDMEDSAHLVAIQQVFDRVWDRGRRNIGIVLQAYLYRTPEDVDRYLARGVRIRLCKGAYAEPPSVAYPRKRDVDRAFAALSERLLASGLPHAIATHDERLIDHARRFAEREGIPRTRFEFQFLYGIRRDLQERLAAEGYRVRVYIPFGTAWYPYVMRRLAERPANLLFLARHVLRG
ncbi:MAG TPA: proline dehydrogenase family protein [bacterium]|nr:proline dehydrogenase family protein [bacterium]